MDGRQKAVSWFGVAVSVAVWRWLASALSAIKKRRINHAGIRIRRGDVLISIYSKQAHTLFATRAQKIEIDFTLCTPLLPIIPMTIII